MRLSARALSRSWARTALSVSGVAVAIASVVVLIGAGVGAERALERALEPLGRNLLVVSASRIETNALRGGSRSATTLRLADREAIEREVPGVLRTAPVYEVTTRGRVGGRTLSVRACGTTPEFAEARNFSLVAGRFLEEDDLRESRRVVVVGALVVEELFLGESPLGRELLFGRTPFRIVGVTQTKGVTAEGANEDELVFLPLTAALRRLSNVDFLQRVYVQTGSAADLPRARRAIEALLRRRHDVRPGGKDDFGIQDQTALLRARQRIGGSLAPWITGLAAAALALGGIGLLAVSLLSVRERFAEIGLRLAVGGRPRDILIQFLTESVMISLLGGAAGLALGAAGIGIGAAWTRWPMVLAPEAVVYSLAISAAIAIVFGSYPALRAARLDPIAALNSR